MKYLILVLSFVSSVFSTSANAAEALRQDASAYAGKYTEGCKECANDSHLSAKGILSATNPGQSDSYEALLLGNADNSVVAPGSGIDGGR